MESIAILTMTLAIIIIVVTCCLFALFPFHGLHSLHLLDSSLAKIPGPPCSSWLKGHISQLFDKQDGPQFHLDLTEKYDRVAKIKGLLGEEQLYISDPLALQSILVKDQEMYEETKVFIENNKLIFGEGLVATVGDHHKKQRKLVTPAFSMRRLQLLVPVLYDVAHRLVKGISAYIDSQDVLTSSQKSIETQKCKNTQTKVDMSGWFSRATLESIGCAGIGYSLDPLDSPSNNPYTEAVRDLIPTMFQTAFLRLLTPFIVQIGSPSLRRSLLNFVPVKAVQRLKKMSDVMDTTCRDVLNNKRSILQSGLIDDRSFGITGDEKDIMSILLKENESANENERLSEAELLGQMNVLIFGAQDTTSSALSRVLHLLSLPEHFVLQNRLREEILHACENHFDNDLKYEDLNSLPVLDAVLKETLRLYPPVPFVRRIALQSTTLPLSRPIRLTDDTHILNIRVPKGTTIWVSISGANRLHDVWGLDACEWNPERWLSSDLNGTKNGEHKRTKLPGIYSGMMTFLGGGRSCIGYRFALTEMKIILSTLLSAFIFKATEDRIVWNLAQILSPSVRLSDGQHKRIDKQGMPVVVEMRDCIRKTMDRSGYHGVH